MAVDPLWSSVVLQLDCNGANNSTTFTDLSSSGHVVTAAGNMKVSTANVKTGSGSAFGAADGALTVASSSDFTFGTGDFRLRAWVRFLSGSGNHAVFSLGSNWTLYLGSGTLYLFDGSSNILSSGSVVLGDWHWVDLVRIAGVLYLRVDGAAASSVAYTTNMASSNLVIGDNTLNSAKISGYLDSIQVMKGEVGPLELGVPLGPLPTDVEPPPRLAYDAHRGSVALLLNPAGQNNSTALVDQGLAGRSLSAFGNARLRVAQSKFTVASLFLDGTGDYFKLASSSAFAFTGDFTLGVWVRPTANTNSRATIVANAMNSWAAGASYLLRYGTSGTSPGKVAFGLQGNDPLLVSTSTVALDVWTYVEVARSGSAVRLSVGGTIEATATDSSTWDFSTLGTLLGANLWDGGDGYFTGYIGPVRIVDGAADHTANFTPPTDAFTTYFGAFSGVVKDSANDETDSRVRVYREEAGELIGSVVSDATTGYYEIPTPFVDEHSVLIYPSDSDPSPVPLQAQVFNGVFAVPA